jgi:hypothetical protein
MVKNESILDFFGLKTVENGALYRVINKYIE